MATYTVEYPFVTIAGPWTSWEHVTTVRLPDGTWVQRVRTSAPGGAIVRVDDHPVDELSVLREAIVARMAHRLPEAVRRRAGNLFVEVAL